MKFRVEAKTLAAELRTVKKIAPKSTPVSFLTGVMIEVNEEVTMRCRDFSMAYRVSLKDEDVVIERSGSALVNAATLYKFVSKMSGILTLHTTSQHLVITGDDGSRCKVAVMDGEDDSEIELGSLEGRIEAEIFVPAFDFLRVFTQHNDYRPQLYSIGIEKYEGLYYAYATDGTRAGIYNLPELDFDEHWTIPMDLVMKMPEDVEVIEYWSEGFFRAKSSRWDMTAQRYSDELLGIDFLLKKVVLGFRYEIEVERESFLSALSYINLAATKTNTCVVSITQSEMRMGIVDALQNVEVEKAIPVRFHELQNENSAPAQFEIGLDPKALSVILKQFGEDDLKIHLQTKDTVIKIMAEKNSGIAYLMPMLLPEDDEDIEEIPEEYEAE